MTYSLRFPFMLTADHEIGGVSEPVKVAIDSRELVLALKSGSGKHILTVAGFETFEAAARFAETAWASLGGVLVDRNIPFDAPCSVSPVRYLPTPTVSPNAPQFGPIDGMADDDRAIAFRTGERIVKFGVGAPTVVVSAPAGRFLADLIEWAQKPGITSVPTDERLRTAIELYSASFSEASRRAKFLTLVMVLEVLAEKELKSATALSMLQRWESETNRGIEAASPHSDDLAALEALKRELFFRRRRSIRSSVRILVRETLAADPDVDGLVRRAVDAYDKRGILVHEGTLAEPVLARAAEDARVISHRVLREAVGAVANRRTI